MTKKKWFTGIGVFILLAVLVLCVVVAPTAVRKHRNYAILTSFATAKFPKVRQVHPHKGVTDCYNAGQVSCPTVSYDLTRTQCIQALRAIAPSIGACAYQATNTYKGHTIQVRAGETISSANSLVVSLIK